MGSIVVPFWGSYLGSYKVIPKKELQVLEPMGISVTPARAFECTRGLSKSSDLMKRWLASFASELRSLTLGFSKGLEGWGKGFRG